MSRKDLASGQKAIAALDPRTHAVEAALMGMRVGRVEQDPSDAARECGLVEEFGQIIDERGDAAQLSDRMRRSFAAREASK